MYESVGQKLGDYCVIAPDMGGHASEKRDFRSARAEAAALHDYLLKSGRMKIKLLYGASLGAAVALKMLDYTDLEIENVYLDGAPVARLGLVMRNIFAPVLVWQKKMIVKDREKGISDFVKRYGRDIAEHMQKRIWFDWGEKELYTKTSKPLVEKLYPNAHIIVREGYEHCEYMMKENEDYIRNIQRIIQK